MKKKTNYLVLQKQYYTDGSGLLVCISSTKREALKWIKQNYPSYKPTLEGRFENDDEYLMIHIEKHTVPII